MEDRAALAELVAELIADNEGYNGRDAPGHKHAHAGHWDSSGMYVRFVLRGPGPSIYYRNNSLRARLRYRNSPAGATGTNIKSGEIS